MLPIEPLKGNVRRPDLRNHRKLLVVDGHVGFTGSQNLTEPGYNKPKNHKAGREWVELMVAAPGPGRGCLEAVFAGTGTPRPTRSALSSRYARPRRDRRGRRRRRGRRDVAASSCRADRAS